MTNALCFDIETIPLAEDKLIRPTFEANKTLRDPLKIKADLDEKEAAWRSKLALDATTGQVAMIGVAGRVNRIFDCGPEDSMIRSFWTQIDGELGQGNRVIGFNIFAFDLPFLVRRSWVHGIKIPAIVRKGRYWNDGIIDLMEVWSCGKREQTISLNNLCKFLRLGEKSGNGADFATMSKEKQIEYLTHDLKITAAAAKILIPED